MRQMLKVDLRKIEGEGEFACPICGEIISPDDESGMTYEILDLETQKTGALQEVIVRCLTCRSMIRIAGFEALSETETMKHLDDYLNFLVDPEKIG